MKNNIDKKGRFVRIFPLVKRKCMFCENCFIVPSYSPRKFCSMSCARKSKSGFDSPFWKGGKAYRRKGGYTRIYVSKGKYMQEHRAVMEKYLGRKLKLTEAIHHKNGVKDDNRIENLEIVNMGRHTGHITCPHCHKGFSIL